MSLSELWRSNRVTIFLSFCITPNLVTAENVTLYPNVKPAIINKNNHKNNKIKFDDPAEEDGFAQIEISHLSLENNNSVLSYVAFLREDVGYSYLKPVNGFSFTRQDKQISKLKSTLNFEFQLQLPNSWKAVLNINYFYDASYQLNGRDNYSNETLTKYEHDLEIFDAFVEGSITKKLYFKFGRQIQSWGESDFFQVTDVLNPRDNRELGVADITSLRLPVTSSVFTYTDDFWSLDLVANHEIRTNKSASKGSDFDRLISQRPFLSLQQQDIPKNNFGNTEGAIRYSQVFAGGDLSLIYASVYEDNFYLDFDSGSFVPRYKKINVFGMSGNMVKGSWLYKMDIARTSGASFSRSDLSIQLTSPKSWVVKNKNQYVVGLEYSGIADLGITFEAHFTEILDYENFISEDKISKSFAMRIQYDMFNQTLKPQLVWFGLDNQNGSIYRLQVDYEPVDELTFSTGIVVFDANSKTDRLYPFKNNNQIFASIKYSFQGSLF